MGGMCTTQTGPNINLPSSSKAITGTDIPEWVSEAGKRLFQQATGLASSEFPAYQGQRIASYDDGSKLTPEEMQAQELLGRDTYQQYFQQAADIAGERPTTEQLLGTPETMDEYLKTYQAAVDPAVEELERQFDRQRNLNKAQAVSRGAFGGSRAEIEDVLGTSELARQTANIRKQAGAEGLLAERAARAEAERIRLQQQKQAQDLPVLIQNLEQQQAQGLITAGQAQRILDQQALDLAYADYLEQRQYPREMINYALGVLKGVPYEQQQYSLTKGQTTAPGAQSPSIYGQTIGGLGSLASAYFLGKQ
jgi:hypothetical protein|tara:strand:+ start:1581 stop:2504 length:924 start_codon:yes stop_codon:yes gene_type:complete